MRKIYLLASLFTLSITANLTVKAQNYTVFTDNFNRTSVSLGGTPTVSYTNFTGGGSISEGLVSGSNYQLYITSGTSSNEGRITAPITGYSSPFNPILSQNIGIVTWTFNMRTSSAAGSTTLSTGTAAGAVVLCASSSNTNIYNGSNAQGYAVVFNSGSNYGVSLVNFSAGLHTNNVLISPSSSVPSTDYYSVLVTYNPSNNLWFLYMRDDGSGGFADPSSGVSTLVGTATDNTYTSNSNTLFGAVYSWSAGSGQVMNVDNYTVGIADCSGTPAPGNTVASATSVCTGNITNLSLQNFTSGYGPTYQWASAPDVSGSPGTFSSVSGATNTTYSPSVSSTTWYECTVTCPYGSNATSNPVQVTALTLPAAIGGPASICNGLTGSLTETTTGGSWSSSNTSVLTVGSTGTITGVSAGNATVTYTGSNSCIATVSETILPAPSAITLSPASSYSVCLGSAASPTASASSPVITVLSQNFNSGMTGQVGGTWTVANSGATSPYNWAIVSPPGYSDTTFSGDGSPFMETDADIAGNVNLVTSLQSPSFSTVGYSAATLSFNYYCESSSSYDVAAEIDYSTDGGITWTQLYNYYNTVTGSQAWTAGTPTQTISLPSGALGQSNVMLRWYYNSTFGYYWVLDNISLTVPSASLSSSAFTWSGPSGLSCTTCASPSITPTSLGTSAYTVSAAYGSCSTTNTVSVTIAGSGTITGNAPVCVGSNITLADATSGGTWSNSAGAAATVGTGGVVTGASAGTANISYTVSTCTPAIAVVTVNAVPNISNFTPPTISSTCGSLSSTVTVNSTTLAAGTYTVTYNLSGANSATNSTATLTMGLAGIGTFSTAAFSSNGSTTLTISAISNSFSCASSLTSNNTVAFTVSSIPSSISGTQTVCVGLSTTLSDAGGGTWSSSNTSVATASGTTGVVTGAGAGSATITYSLNGCITTTSVTVNATSPISGSLGLCVGSNSSLSDPSGIGSWTSANAAVASVNASSGLATGVSLGSTTITFTLTSTGCIATASVSVTTAPYSYTASGGGSFCAGGSGVNISLSGSSTTASYELFSGGLPVPPIITGTGSALTFTSVNIGGTYSVVANPGTGCQTSMYGTVTVSANPLPAVYSITGGGNYCAGGLGQHIGVNPSDVGINYKLYSNGTQVGLSIPGTSGAIDFGLKTATGNYQAVAVNSTTGCLDTMSGTATIAFGSAPVAYSMNTGGAFCSGGTGIDVNLSSSTTGVNYQLYLGTVATGSLVGGSTGFGIDFGTKTTAGIYTVIATNPISGCSTTMTGSTLVTVNPLPTTNNVTGGGAFCSNGLGVHVGLNTSTPGVSYQLYNNGSIAGSPLTGTGSSLDYGLITAVGVYSVMATNVATSCTNNMTGTVTVTTNPLPNNAYTIPANGIYCVGGSGVDITLSSSDFGVNYRLYDNNTPIGAAVAGNGTPLDFGLQTLAGNYTVVAINPVTTCSVTMTGFDVVSVNPLPPLYNVTGGGSFCAGGTGVPVGLSGSQSGIKYQLYSAGAPVGLFVAGNGLPITFGLQTASGSYTVVSTSSVASCQRNMAGSVGVTVNPLPTAYTLTGGGSYCANGTGVHIGLSGSDLSTNYQLYLGVGVVSAPLPGTGGPIDFGAITIPGTTYTVIANNPTTTCSSNMTGTDVISINPLPTPYLISANAAYCASGPGALVTIPASDNGVNYQLFRGTSIVGPPVAGSGGSISFGVQPAGVYNVMATNTITGCNNNMTGNFVVAMNPLPTAFTVTGGGGYCSGGTGVSIGLSGSTSGIKYQLFLSTLGSGLPILGTGSSISFGLKTTAGNYMVTATNPTTTCTSNMTGSTSVSILPNPGLHNVTESNGGVYCAGGTGVDIGLNGSDIGVNYQLYNGISPVGAVRVGTTGPLDFGNHTTVGTPRTVIATNATTGCTATMSGTAPISISALPMPFPVTGGGSFCPGGMGVGVGVFASEAGNTYQLYNGGIAVPGALVTSVAGEPIVFGAQDNIGAYTVISTNVAGCTNSMTGSVNVANYPLPTLYTVTGGGSYCAGGTGLNISLTGSDTGVAYQLYNNDISTPAIITGNGHAISFGNQMSAGSYTVVGTSNTTTCINEMFDSVMITVNPTPTVDTLTGGGSYCVGGAGVDIMINNSDMGVNYQLYHAGSPVGSLIPGTGAPLDLGTQTASGTYTVLGTNVTTFCASNMYGIDTVSISLLPAVHSVTGGGNYCSGGAGEHVHLNNSDTGVSYQLYNGASPAGVPMAGTGAPLDFGAQTAAGIYTVVAKNNTTNCSMNMVGSASISITPAPTVFSILGGGGYCIGGTGVDIKLSGSQAGTTYQLIKGGTPASSLVLGSGAPIDFGVHTAPDSYSIIAVNTATTCANSMGTTIVTINPLPTAYSVSGAATSYCAGGTGINIYLSRTDVGVNYQLYRGGGVVGTSITGMSAALDFGPQTLSGTYTIVATNPTTGCVNNMTGSAVVAITPLPTQYSMIGGGSYCAGGTGVHVGLIGSSTGVQYQLFNGGIPVGTSRAGSGSPIDYGAQTTAGVYTVVATNTTTRCTNNMAGGASVAINPLPIIDTATGGGSYCNGGAGVNVGLNGSVSGINYQLFYGHSPAGLTVAGTGTDISFGLQTAAGTYSIMATNAVTGCADSMVGTASVAINPLPSIYSVTGGGNYCPGGAGMHIGLGGSNRGVSYQLFNGAGTVGHAIAGTGSTLDFGSFTSSTDLYTVSATNLATGCTSNMAGSATVGLNPLPDVYNVTGGGNYCTGGPSVHIGLNTSGAGVSYQLYTGGSALTGSPVTGTGTLLDMGAYNIAGTYTVVAINPSTLCSVAMSGSAVITVNTSVVPTVNISTGMGDTVCAGTLVNFTAAPVNGGVSPTYQWIVNGAYISTAPAYSYTPSNGDIVTLTMVSSMSCASPTTASKTISMTVNPMVMPSIFVTETPGNVVCAGTLVNFVSSTTNAGTSPSYQWKLNGLNAGTLSTFSCVPHNGDIIDCEMSSSNPCSLENTVTSNRVTMEVDAPVAPTVYVQATPGASILTGQTVVLTANVTYGGSVPTFQWFINGGLALPPQTTSEFIYNSFNDRDSVSCVVTNSGGCAGLKGSGYIIMRVRNNVGVKQINSSVGDIQLIPNPNNGAFTLKGSLGVTTDEAVTVEITDIIGQVIYSSKVMAQGGEINEHIQLTTTPANGMYMVLVRSDAGNTVFHMVIEQ